MSFVNWCYQYYLGRYAEDMSVLDWHESAMKGDFKNLRTHMMKSSEYEGRGPVAQKSKPGTFFSPEAYGPKVTVLGNCQGPNIAMAIAAVSGQPISVCGLEIMNITESRDEMIGIIQDSDYVVACKTYSPQYEAISPEFIRDVYGKYVIEYSPIHFTGIHPDIITLGSFGQRVLSPLGDYNSRIILSAFLDGAPASHVCRAFNNETYVRAGYQHEFKWSENTMREREQNLGSESVQIADWFMGKVREEPLLYTTNHPNSKFFLEISGRILDKIGISKIPIESDLFANTLSKDAFWPVDIKISELSNVGYSTGPRYWKDGIMMSREEFIVRSYAGYAKYDREFLVNSLISRKLDLHYDWKLDLLE